jgi:hypothetical protein
MLSIVRQPTIMGSLSMYNRPSTADKPFPDTSFFSSPNSPTHTHTYTHTHGHEPLLAGMGMYDPEEEEEEEEDGR